MLVRSAGLAESMSRYLIRRIEETATIVLRPYTEIVAIDGGHHLEFVRWHNNQTGQTEEHKIRHIFVMTGADPNTSWLDGCIALDSKGFIKTGPDLSQENLSAAQWSLARQPYRLGDLYRSQILVIVAVAFAEIIRSTELLRVLAHPTQNAQHREYGPPLQAFLAFAQADLTGSLTTTLRHSDGRLEEFEPSYMIGPNTLDSCTTSQPCFISPRSGIRIE
jgi:hypothetical protein